MKMQMIHHLSGWPAIIKRYSVTTLKTNGMRRLPHRQEYPAGQLRIIKRIQILNVALWHHEHMHRRLGMEIVKGHRKIVLPQKILGATMSNGTKNAVVHKLIINYQPLEVSKVLMVT